MELQDYLQHAPVASLFFVITILVSWAAFERPQLKKRLTLRPYAFVYKHQYDTIITSGFIHGDWFHLIFNMMAYYFFAFQLEMGMTKLSGPIGHIYFAGLYLACMMLADVTTIVKHRNDITYGSLGASGAIAGVIFSSIIFNPGGSIVSGFFPMELPSPVFAVLYVVGSAIAGRMSQDNINHDAHLWGALFGFGITSVMYHAQFLYFLQVIKDMLHLS